MNESSIILHKPGRIEVKQMQPLLWTGTLVWFCQSWKENGCDAVYLSERHFIHGFTHARLLLFNFTNIMQDVAVIIMLVRSFLKQPKFHYKVVKVIPRFKKEMSGPQLVWCKQNLPNLVLSPLVVQAVLNNYLCKWLKWCGLDHFFHGSFPFFCCVKCVFFLFVFSDSNIWARLWKIKGVWFCHIFRPQSCGRSHWQAHRYGKLR